MNGSRLQRSWEKRLKMMRYCGAKLPHDVKLRENLRHVSNDSKFRWKLKWTAWSMPGKTGKKEMGVLRPAARPSQYLFSSQPPLTQTERPLPKSNQTQALDGDLFIHALVFGHEVLISFSGLEECHVLVYISRLRFGIGLFHLAWRNSYLNSEIILRICVFTFLKSLHGPFASGAQWWFQASHCREALPTNALSALSRLQRDHQREISEFRMNSNEFGRVRNQDFKK